MLLLFCVANHSNRDSAPLRKPTVAASRLSGLPITWLPHKPLKILTARVDDNWRQIVAPLDYRELLCELHAGQDIIPMRYGSLLADYEALRQWLKANTRTLLSQLERVRDGVEITVLLPDHAAGVSRRTEAATAEKTGPGRGAAYLQARRNQYVDSRNSGVLCLLKDTVEGLYRTCKVEPVHYTDRPLVSVHFLVPRGRVKIFQQRLQPLLEQNSVWISSGPCPPFSFLNS